MITLEDVWLKYRIGFKEDGKVVHEDFWALKGINLNVDKGECFAVIGENGSGKTTLLRVINGMLKADRGMVKVAGRISGLMEIQAGFHNDLTGRENIYNISSLLGLTREKIDGCYDDIVSFASIGRFINAPIKTYSQGMLMRLAFSIAIHVYTDILLVDDIFAVGDIYAQRKCINKMFELKEKGMTIVFVSHDLDIARRLCQRGILLRDGRIIKEGAIDKLGSYYLETVGSKEGIAILEKGPLGIVFNNGRLILRWKDTAITKNLSGQGMLSSLGREYQSTTATWSIQKPSRPDEIIAVGRWPDIPVAFVWKIYCASEKEFSWDMLLEVDKKVDLQSYEADVILSDSYKSWFTLESESDFPRAFLHENEWECSRVDDSLNWMLGLMPASDTLVPLPALILDRSGEDSPAICQIGNTGLEASGRAIRFNYVKLQSEHSPGKYKFFSCNIKIFEAEDQEKLKCYTEQAKQVGQSKVIRSDSLALACRNRKIEIFWQDMPLTKDAGLETKFVWNDQTYSSSGGSWIIKKENSRCLIIDIFWGQEMPFFQAWRLEIQDDKTIKWEADIEVKKESKIRSRQAELFLSEKYERWLTPSEGGDFQVLEKKGNTVALKKYINDYAGVESFCAEEGYLMPGVVFSHQDGRAKVSYISKNQKKMLNTKLHYLEIDSLENSSLATGRHTFFKGAIKIAQEIKDEKAGVSVKRRDPLQRIDFKRASLVFEYGKLRLFFKGAEVTKGLGLYSSVLCRGIWHDSSQGLWQVKALEDRRLVAVGRWPWLPVVQKWEVVFLDDTTVLWEITRDAWEDFDTEREQVSLMLSDKYQEWFVQKKTQGRFPKEFSDHNRGIFWDRLWSGDTQLPIGAKGCKLGQGIFSRRLLPSVVWDCSQDSFSRHLSIENTDTLFKARVLQCELESVRKDSAQKNKYFSGKVKIC